jgi:hypothetical protein
VIIGAASLTLQILGGHTQYVFYSALAAALYVLLRVSRADARGGVMLATAAMAVSGVALAAVQLLPVIDAVPEGVRADRLSYQFASEFSMPWSGFLTMLAPGFFGHLAGTTYWGDWYYWEVAPFIGIVGLSLAAYGALCGDRQKRQFSLVLCLAFLLLALGSSTPLFALLHAHVPPFDRFRASGRALFHFSLFAAMLAAVGYDALVRGQCATRPLVVVLLCLSVALATLAGWIRSSAALGDVVNARQNVERLLQLPPNLRDAEVQRLTGTDETRAERLRRLLGAKDDLAQQKGANAATRMRAFMAYRDAVVEAMQINPWLAFRSASRATMSPSRSGPIQSRQGSRRALRSRGCSSQRLRVSSPLRCSGGLSSQPARPMHSQSSASRRCFASRWPRAARSRSTWRRRHSGTSTGPLPVTTASTM